MSTDLEAALAPPRVVALGVLEIPMSTPISGLVLRLGAGPGAGGAAAAPRPVAQPSEEQPHSEGRPQRVKQARRNGRGSSSPVAKEGGKRDDGEDNEGAKRL